MKIGLETYKAIDRREFSNGDFWLTERVLSDGSKVYQIVIERTDDPEDVNRVIVEFDTGADANKLWDALAHANISFLA